MYPRLLVMAGLLLMASALPVLGLPPALTPTDLMSQETTVLGRDMFDLDQMVKEYRVTNRLGEQIGSQVVHVPIESCNNSTAPQWQPVMPLTIKTKLVFTYGGVAGELHSLASTEVAWEQQEGRSQWFEVPAFGRPEPYLLRVEIEHQTLQRRAAYEPMWEASEAFRTIDTEVLWLEPRRGGGWVDANANEGFANKR